MVTTVKIDSSNTGLAIAEETSPKVLPGSPVWYDQEPNEENDFGATLATVARAPIEPSRQRKKGTITGMDVAAGFSADLTSTNMQRVLQGFFFADARELKTTKPLNAAQVTITGADATAGTYTAASGLDVFAANDLVFVTGFNTAANNGLKVVASSTATAVTLAGGGLVTEAGNASVVVQKVGVEYAAGDAKLTKTGNVYGLELTTANFTGQDGIIPGAWVYVGGDATASRFTDPIGYARIRTVSAKNITFDQLLLNVTSAADNGAGKKIQVFMGNIIKNEKNPALIKKKSYTIERTLGTTDIGAQAEYITGAFANEYTLNVPVEDKVSADLGFVAIGYETRSGASGDERMGGTHIPAPGEECYNTSSNIPAIAVLTYDPSRSKQKELFTYCESFTLTINNNVSVDKAVGVLGGFDVSTGNFEVDVSTDAYFAYVEALKSIRNNADVSALCVIAQKNYGCIWDIPLATVGGGQLNVENNTGIKTSLEVAGAENKWGYTLQYQAFAYLPTVATD